MRLALAIGLLAALAAASMGLGAARLEGGPADAGAVLWLSRLPRTLAPLLAGAGLALAGVVVQLALQSRLVEPGLTGTPEAAMLGLIGVTLAAPGAAIGWKMAASAGAAMAGTAGFLLLARRVPRHEPVLLPLVGLIYGGILGAAALWLAWTTDLLQMLGIWQSGDFSGVIAGRYEILWIIVAVVAGLWLLADRITLLGLGEDHARSLGLATGQVRVAAVALVSLASAAVVATVGAVPFVGLVVPNIVSRWRGDNLRANLPLVAWGGAVAVLAADLIGRLIRWPYEIPASTILAVAGAALVLWLLHAAPAEARARG